MSDHLAVAARFAHALDREDYGAAAACLAPTCEYSIGSEMHRGPEAIIATYRESGEWAAAQLDSVRYESSVRPSVDAPGGAIVTFTDHIEARGHRLAHRSEQRLWFDEAGRIRLIEHVDLPGERDALEVFFAQVGIARLGPVQSD